MKKYLILFLLLPMYSFAATVLYPIGGGTGTSSVNSSDVGKYLKISDDSPFTYTFDTPAGGGANFPFTDRGSYVSTSTIVGFLTGMFSVGSSTIQDLHATNFNFGTLSGGLGSNGGTVYTAATTTFTGATGLTYTNGNVSCDVATVSVPGCISAASFTVFNNKQAALGTINGLVGSNGTTIYQVASSTLYASLSAGALGVNTAGVVYTSATTTFSTGLTYLNGAVTCTTGTLSVFGCLASADFTNFNNKVSSTSLSGGSVISYTSGTGVITTVGGTFGAGNYVFPTGLETIPNASSTVLSVLNSIFVGRTATTTINGDNGTSTFSSDLKIKTSSANALNIQDAFGTQLLNVYTASSSGTTLFAVFATTSPAGSLCGGSGITCLFSVDGFGHVSASSTAPTLSSCGTGPTLTADSNDLYGQITVGTSATTCTLNYGKSHAIGSYCTVQQLSMSLTNAYTLTQELTGFTYAETALSGAVLVYHCDGS